jgi:hypothetical protein
LGEWRRNKPSGIAAELPTKSQASDPTSEWDPELAKREMQKRITKLILTPVDTQNGRGFEVSGDLRLFAGPDDVMVNQSSPKLIDHYKAFVLPIKMMLKSPKARRGQPVEG